MILTLCMLSAALYTAMSRLIIVGTGGENHVVWYDYKKLLLSQ
jgi:hypothetical protein